jgi:DNA repair protein RadC
MRACALSSDPEERQSAPPVEVARPRQLPARRRGELEARAGQFGAAVLEDCEALELVGGVDQAAAVALLAAFGSLPEVLGAPFADLRRVAGARPALRLKLAQDVAGRLLARPLRIRDLLTSSSQVADYLRSVMVGAPREQFRVLFLDKRNRLIADELMNEGTVDHAPVYPREVVRRALELHASAVILAHNHPAADPNPSAADVEMTRQIVDAARPLRIAVHDHVLVAGQAAVSFRQLGVL